jgi:hypothetical protein
MEFPAIGEALYGLVDAKGYLVRFSASVGQLTARGISLSLRLRRRRDTHSPAGRQSPHVSPCKDKHDHCHGRHEGKLCIRQAVEFSLGSHDDLLSGCHSYRWHFKTNAPKRTLT